MFGGNHGRMNYTDSAGDLMVSMCNALKQRTAAGTQLKVEEEEQRRGRDRAPLPAPPRSLGPRWEEALQTHPGL